MIRFLLVEMVSNRFMQRIQSQGVIDLVLMILRRHEITIQKRVQPILQHSVFHLHINSFFFTKSISQKYISLIVRVKWYLHCLNGEAAVLFENSLSPFMEYHLGVHHVDNDANKSTLNYTHMRKRALLLVMFMAAFVAHGQSEIKSKIISAKVFTQGAELNRTATLTLKKGKNEFKFTKISANLDPKTIQIDGEGITILSVRHEIDFIETNTPQKVSVLMEKRNMIMDTLERVNMEISILKKEAELLSKNMKVIGAQGTRGEDYQKALEYFSNKFKGNTNSSFQLKVKKRKLQQQFDEMEKQIISFNVEEKEPTTNIYLVVDADKAMKQDISISYAVSEAGWFPGYDIRATNVESPLALTYKARVMQNTGIDWKNVKLTLSSGDLESSGTAPELNPFYLGGINRNRSGYESQGQITGRVVGGDDGLPLPQVTVFVKGTTIGVPTDANGYYNIQVPNGNHKLIFRYTGYLTQEIDLKDRSRIDISLAPDMTSLGEVVVTAQGFARDRKSLGYTIGKQSGWSKRETKTKSLPINIINYQTSFVYEIKHPYDIPSSGQAEMVDIQTKSVAADYVYSTSPKAKENAYLVAQIPQWEKLKLLDGESNLYFEGSFVGKSLIDTSIGRDTLDISLGKDEGIVVSRKRLKEYEKSKFLSSKKREQRKFEITIVNTKSTQISINVFDQIPLATSKDYKVDVDELSGAILNQETGLLIWQLQLKPGQKKVIQFGFSVECPKHMDLDID